MKLCNAKSVRRLTIHFGCVIAAIVITTLPSKLQAQCCPDSAEVKFVRAPDTNAVTESVSWFDINTTLYDAAGQNRLADEFSCTNNGPITEIHLWGGWVGDHVDTNASFFLGIYADSPTNYFRGNVRLPGTNLLWKQYFTPGTYTVCPWMSIPRDFSQALTGGSAPGDVFLDAAIAPTMYYLCFYPTNGFVQQGSIAFPTNYWLSVVEIPSVNTQAPFGWTTTAQNTDTNSAVAWDAQHPWWPIRYADTNNLLHPMHFAFKVGTSTNTVTTNNCGPLTIQSYTAVVLTWPSGTLQSSTNVNGPYSDVVGATSPYTNITTGAAQQFYRLRCTP